MIAVGGSGEDSARDLLENNIQDAHRAITLFATWVNNADTKAGLLAAALTVVVAGCTQQSQAITLAFDVSEGSSARIALALLLSLLVCVVFAFAVLATVLVPRTSDGGIKSRFAYPTLASSDWSHPTPDLEISAREAWVQAATLAAIVEAKFRALRIAALATFLSLPLFVLWVLVAANLKPPQ